MSSTPRFFDSHCHLNYDYAPKTTAELVREAADQGVTHLMTVGTEMATLGAVATISDQFENVFHTVGVHPHEAALMTDNDLTILENAAAHSKCQAIGEIGLDYYYGHSPRDTQIQRLNEQLKLALRVKLPVVIHSRDAEADLLQSLEQYVNALPTNAVPGIIHCFTGTESFANRCIEWGFYISFSGILTFKNAENLRQIAKKLPLERILIETDSPYLAPVPFRGKKCEPSMVRMTAQCLSETRGIPLNEIAETTFHNTCRAFGLPIATR
jgi:TatD DNase family protein